MKKSYFLMAFVALALVAISCTSFLPNRFERFVDREEKTAPNYTEKDWQKVSDQFEKLVAQYDKVKDKLSKDDKLRIEKAIGRYNALTVKSGFDNVIQKGKEIINKVGGWFDGILSGDEKPSPNQ